jgi:hypothetical protein
MRSAVVSDIAEHVAENAGFRLTGAAGDAGAALQTYQPVPL